MAENRDYVVFDLSKAITALSVKHGVSRITIEKILEEVSRDKELGLHLIKQHTSMVIMKQMFNAVIGASRNLVSLQDKFSAGKINAEEMGKATEAYRSIKEGLVAHNAKVQRLCFPQNYGSNRKGGGQTASQGTSEEKKKAVTPPPAQAPSDGTKNGSKKPKPKQESAPKSEVTHKTESTQSKTTDTAKDTTEQKLNETTGAEAETTTV